MKRTGHGHLCCVLSSPQPPHHSPQPAAVEVLVAAMGAAHQRPQPAAVEVLVAAMGAARQGILTGPGHWRSVPRCAEGPSTEGMELSAPYWKKGARLVLVPWGWNHWVPVCL